MSTTDAAVNQSPGMNEGEGLAETIHKARWPSDRQMAITPFADEDANGREYCFRIADAILASRASAPSAWQPTREQIAATVDAGFRLWCRCVDEIDAMPETQRNDPLRRAQRRENVEARDKALRTADAILALFSLPSSDRGGVG